MTGSRDEVELFEVAPGRDWSIVAVARPAAIDPISSLMADPRSPGVVLVHTRAGAGWQWDTARRARVGELPSLRGAAGITSDGQHLIAIDEAGGVSLVSREGGKQWSASVGDPPAVEGAVRVVFRSAGVVRADTAEIVIHATFHNRTFLVEWEDPWNEIVYTERVLRRSDGVRVADTRVTHALPRLFESSVWLADSNLPRMPHRCGRLSARFVSDDARTAIVGTTSGLLIQLVRAR